MISARHEAGSKSFTNGLGPVFLWRKRDGRGAPHLRLSPEPVTGDSGDFPQAGPEVCSGDDLRICGWRDRLVQRCSADGLFCISLHGSMKNASACAPWASVRTAPVTAVSSASYVAKCSRPPVIRDIQADLAFVWASVLAAVGWEKPAAGQYVGNGPLEDSARGPLLDVPGFFGHDRALLVVVLRFLEADVGAEAHVGHHAFVCVVKAAGGHAPAGATQPGSAQVFFL